MSTTVILLRHAKPTRGEVESDFLRGLSEDGKLVQHKMNLYLKGRGLIPDAIWHSPFKRAEETAEIIGKDFGVTPTEELALGEFFDEDELTQKLPPPQEKRCIYLVGHGPQLMRLATYLVGTPCYPASPTPSSALVLRFVDSIKPGSAQIVNYHSPESDLSRF